MGSINVGHRAEYNIYNIKLKKLEVFEDSRRV